MELSDEADADALAVQVASMRNASTELDAYAQDVRARGGIFKLGLAQIVMGGAVLIAAFVWGCNLTWRTWSTPGLTFFADALLMLSSVGLMLGLIRSQAAPP